MFELDKNFETAEEGDVVAAMSKSTLIDCALIAKFRAKMMAF